MKYDVTVIGAGTIGLATGYYLAKQGATVLMIDTYDPPHQQGSHGGDTRLIRHAYGEGRAYTPLALRSQILWDQLQIESEAPLFKKTGILSFANENSPFINEIKQSASHYQLPLTLYDHNGLKHNFPSLDLTDKAPQIGCFESESGVLFVDQCMKTYRRLAQVEGADLIVNQPVTDLVIDHGGVRVVTQAQQYTSQQVVIATGAWQAQWFEQLNLDIQLTPKRQVIGWFDADPNLFDASVFPGFTAETDEGLFYGFPSMNGSGVKLGRHDYGMPVDPNQFERDFGYYPEDEHVLRSFLEKWMPRAAGKLKKGNTCLYTMTTDEDFIIDQHPIHKQVWIAAGFSGHGFKFASGIGESLADRVMQRESTIDLAMFSFDRFNR
ncbi:N-methyl-L-tryptophan oxidase [Amphibacillus cookii]|uniref:N-methyl-L-tryptophan oxidase n=1 Tax=Amphibacillus cookii TaxID=767787 RepID=UPI0019570062|nr:N-methyl-L-tryptophan oxidase [Amphibacillus cookii]MBM7542661.1 monomeric sarcosine oxidase [Amphibacillus cookii]